MASTSITIEDTAAAIADGTIPGEFSEGRLAFAFPEVSSRSSRGKDLYWRLTLRVLKNGAPVAITDKMLVSPVAQLPAGYQGEIITNSGFVGGKDKVSAPTYVVTGKNIGKKNASNVATQAFRDALSSYNNHVKKAGKKEQPADSAYLSPFACRGAEDAADLDAVPPPMLLKKRGATKDSQITEEDYKDGCTAQYKYNGVHLVAFGTCAVDSDEKETVVRLYSRTGGDYLGLEPQRAEIKALSAAAPKVDAAKYGVPKEFAAAYDLGGKPPLVYLDGEAYLHGKSLQWASGQSRKEADEGTLNYHVFDIFFPYAIHAGHNMESKHRQAYLDALFATPAAKKLKLLKRVPNFPVCSDEETDALFEKALEEKYEGLVLRKDTGIYRYSYKNWHSSDVVKVKPKLDAEFAIVDFSQGDKGRDVGAIKWICEVSEENVKKASDRTFAVVPNMTIKDRQSLFKCLSVKVPAAPGSKKMVTRFERDVKGRMLTVQYSELSEKTNKPQQPKAIALRSYEQGAGADPIKKLYEECGITFDEPQPEEVEEEADAE